VYFIWSLIGLFTSLWLVDQVKVFLKIKFLFNDLKKRIERFSSIFNCLCNVHVLLMQICYSRLGGLVGRERSLRKVGGSIEQCWLAQFQYKVTGWGIMFICGMVFFGVLPH